MCLRCSKLDSLFNFLVSSKDITIFPITFTQNLGVLSDRSPLFSVCQKNFKNSRYSPWHLLNPGLRWFIFIPLSTLFDSISRILSSHQNSSLIMTPKNLSHATCCSSAEKSKLCLYNVQNADSPCKGLYTLFALFSIIFPSLVQCGASTLVGSVSLFALNPVVFVFCFFLLLPFSLNSFYFSVRWFYTISNFQFTQLGFQQALNISHLLH